MTLADFADLGFFIPEVLIPVVGMFAGVYALGAAIIGYYRTDVSRFERIGFGVAALFLSVPGMLLMPAETIAGIAGIDVTLYTVTIDVAVRAIGGAMLVALAAKNRRQANEKDGTAATA
jgi:TRAP-type uncharacterized transport system fused permease subunit